MSETKNFISQYLTDLKEHTYVIGDVVHKDPKTEEEVKTFGKMNIVDNNSALTFIYGENASGKSFIARCFEMVARARKPSKLPVRSVSVANRTSSGVEKAMIFGNESEQSTGETSVSVMKLALNSLANDSGDGVVILDEPDLGLSPKYSRALGRYIAEFILEHEKNGKALFVISHNDTFIESVIKHYNNPYNSVGVDTDLTLREWLDDDSEYEMEDLDALKDIAIAKWRGIQKIFNR